ncbi:MAG: hypothetical protein ACLRQF_22145 [Thomasclavelia ramosa]
MIHALFSRIYYDICSIVIDFNISNLDFKSAFSAIASCLNNIGPGLDVVGPVSNFGSLPDVSKIVLTFDMLAVTFRTFPCCFCFHHHFGESSINKKIV